MTTNQKALDAIALRKRKMTYRQIGKILGLTHAAVFSYIKRYAPELTGELSTYHIPASHLAYFKTAIIQCKSLATIVEETGYTPYKVRYWLRRLNRGSLFDRVMLHREVLQRRFDKQCGNGCTMAQAIEIVEKIVGRRFSKRIVQRVLHELGVKTFTVGTRPKTA